MVNRRDAVLAVLDTPRCAREVAERIGAPIKSVQTVLHRLVREGVVQCVTPELRQARLHTTTVIGRVARREAIEALRADAGEASGATSVQRGIHNTTADPFSDPSMSPCEPLGVAEHRLLSAYAWVQSGLYRRLALRHLGEPATPRALRVRMLGWHERISMTHVHEVLRGLRERGLAATDGDRVWTLTADGQRLQRLAFGPVRDVGGDAVGGGGRGGDGGAGGGGYCAGGG